ncbi:hypothetical protein [Mesorhizobium waimense]|uniref:ABC transporter ATP-binding protein n=1 Tax=Mesorhizobium waimense TaxID=1300307 RepID=UPI00142DA771
MQDIEILFDAAQDFQAAGPDHIADDICVMQSGSIVERGLTNEVIVRPSHPYTKQLLGAVANPDNPRRSAGPMPVK